MSDEAAQVPVPPAAEGGPAPDEPEVPAVPPPEPTGDPRVDAALARLGELGARPVPEHVEVYEDVHQRLQDLLASAESGDAAERGGPPRPAFPDALRPRP
ncbi:hypothetical protein ACN3XK_34140 [Actinomadura welshii]